MAGYTFKWKYEPPGLIDASILRPDRLAAMPREKLVAQLLRIGNTECPLDDVFHLEGYPGDTLQLPGSPRYAYLGQGMPSGTLIVEGHAGDLAGMEMTGGMLRINGAAGDSLGASMLGGRIVVNGHSGSFTGGPSPHWTEGMTGGEIVITGRAGPRCGLRMRGGMIACHSAAASVGYHMLAGTIVVREGPLEQPGLSLRRGTLLVLDPSCPVTWTPYYQPDCVYEPVFLKVLLGHLEGLGFDIPAAARHGRYQLYSGDRLQLGKGEILQLVRHTAAASA